MLIQNSNTKRKTKDREMIKHNENLEIMGKKNKIKEILKSGV